MFKKNVENFCFPNLISLQQHIPNFTLKLFPMQELQDLKANLVLTIKNALKGAMIWLSKILSGLIFHLMVKGKGNLLITYTGYSEI